VLFATGVMSLFAGRSGDAWVFALHGAGGFALGGMLVWKSRRVWRRLVRPWDRRTAAGAGAAAFVAVSLLSGWAWSSGVQLSFAGYNLLSWHFALGTALTLVVLGHALLRAKPLRRTDLAGRRQFLSVGAVALGEELVELGPSQHRAQRGLGDLRRGRSEGLDLGDRGGGIDHAEVADRRDPGRHVVARDHLLRWHRERDGAQVHSHHPIGQRREEHQSGPFDREQPAEAEDHRSFVLAQHANAE
jgi:hypothetical protein